MQHPVLISQQKLHAMDSMQALSTEMLLEILPYINHKQTLPSLSMVLMEPFLQQRFENHNNVLITQCFTRTTLERPELAKYVKQLDLDLRYVGDSTHSLSPQSTAPSRYEWELLRQSDAHLGLDRGPAFFDSLNSGDNEDVVIVILLHLFPKLEELRIVVYDDSVPYFIFSYENRRSRISNCIERQLLAHLGALRKMEIWCEGFEELHSMDLLP